MPDRANLELIIIRILRGIGLTLLATLATITSANALPDPNQSAADADVAGGVAQGQTGSTVQRRHYVMGTWLGVTVQASTRAQALGAAEAAIEAVDETDRRLSTWREDSELAVVNSEGLNRSVEISQELENDLSNALHWSRRTLGAFSPAMGSLVAAWDLRGSGSVPGGDELREAVETARFTDVLLHHRHIRFGRPGLRIEEGGFGKGAALRDAVAAAQAKGAICVVLDFGGQVAAGGECGAVPIGVADPRDRHSEVATLSLDSGSAATSGLSERGIFVEGVRYGHILDPRDGRPARDWGVVTVVAADPFAADCVSTALFVMGPDAGARWAARQPDIEALFVEQSNGTVRFKATEGIRSQLSPPPGHQVEWIPRVEVRQNGPPDPSNWVH